MLLGLFSLLGVGLLGVLTELQAVRPERYRDLGERQILRTVPIDGYRGSVVDRDGFVLAMSSQAHRVEVDPTMIAHPPTTAAALAPVLGWDPAELEAVLTPDGSGRRYHLLGQGLADEVADQLTSLRDTYPAAMVGVFVLPDEQRAHPAGRLAANLVGRTDPHLAGASGIEAMFDGVMSGADGSTTFEGGRFGSISVGQRVVEPASAGADVVLTIDHRLQYVVDQALLEHCEALEANGASAALSDPRTGELLALSSVVRDETGRCVIPGANRALIDTFEPGSVLKVITMSAALEDLGLEPGSVIDLPTYVRVANKTFTDDHPLPPAEYPLWKILSASSNVGTISVAKEVGPDRLYDYLRSFGFGSPTGIGFIGETNGLVRAPQDWWGSDMGSIAIGQGVAVNIVQLLAAYNTIANQGVYVAPSLVRSLVESDGTIHQTPQEARRVVSAETASGLTDMLTAVVEEGTGTSAALPGYAVAGKTGTAWKAVPNSDGVLRYTDDDGRRRYVVSFVGFVPAEAPQLSLAIMVDEPRTQTMASTAAAPIFAQLAGHALRIMGIPPADQIDNTPTELVRGTPAGLEAALGTDHKADGTPVRPAAEAGTAGEP